MNATARRDAAALLSAYVEAHNKGYRTGNFGTLITLLHPAVEMRFEGLGVGPFVGRAAVLRAFDEDPPGAELAVNDIQREGEAAVCLYGWRGAAAVVAGSIRVEAEGGLIRRIVVRAW